MASDGRVDEDMGVGQGGGRRVVVGDDQVRPSSRATRASSTEVIPQSTVMTVSARSR